uniref:Uncharacterized protein n=1 Tax=Arundo donax TaxID=35708 RepID=A0A0A9C4U7_ARUDO
MQTHILINIGEFTVLHQAIKFHS